MAKSLTKTDNIKYQLQTLASFDPKDIDYPEFDVAYEDGNGIEGFATVSCIELAKESLARIKELEKKVKECEDAVCEEIGNRDRWEEKATNLAEAVGLHFNADVGEHSSANCPINNALELLNQM